jgi:hypothetical protein
MHTGIGRPRSQPSSSLPSPPRPTWRCARTWSTTDTISNSLLRRNGLIPTPTMGHQRERETADDIQRRLLLLAPWLRETGKDLMDRYGMRGHWWLNVGKRGVS